MDLFVTKLGKESDPVLFQFRRGYNPPVSGLKQLAQKFAIWMLKDPSGDESSLGLGGGLRQRVLNVTDSETARSACGEAVALAESQIKESESDGVLLAPSERLKSAKLKHVELVQDVDVGLTVFLEIEISSQSGQTAPLSLSTR